MRGQYQGIWVCGYWVGYSIGTLIPDGSIDKFLLPLIGCIILLVAFKPIKQWVTSRRK